MPDGSYIAKIKVTWDAQGINYFKAMTEENINFDRGTEVTDDPLRTATITFDKYEPIVGIVGY